MSNDLFLARYKRQILLPGFGPEAQAKLATAKVLVIGAGGLGVPALQYLAGMGIGSIGIVDGDVISLDNLHRQIIYTEEEIGQPKAKLAASKLRALNSGISIHAFEEKLSPDNALRLIEPYDVVLDATDNFPARYLINDASVILDKPFVYGAVHQFEGHVSVFNFQGGPTYRCLYPIPPSAAEIPDCNNAGVLGVVPGIIGCRQALETVKIITGIGRSLSGCIQIFDFLNDTERKIKLKARPENQSIQRLQKSYGEANCTSDLQPTEFQEWYDNGRPFQLLDVREPHEFSRWHLPLAQNMPLSRINDTMAFDHDLPLVVYCQTGGRSIRALSNLQAKHPGLQMFNLAGGIENWMKQIKAL
jgi:adenylyltransferase/sulfurtransferase